MDDELKQSDKYWDKKGKPGPWDAIVIGSGMGGMTTAAILAKLGKRVLVLEQHYVPGGFTHMFKRKSWVWDVGVHAVGEVTTRSMPGRVLAALSDGDLKWASLGPVYDEFYYPDDFRIDFPDSPQQFRANLVEAFPQQVGAIDGYLDLVRRVSGSMRGYYFARVLPQWSAFAADRLLASKAETWFRRRTAPELAKLTDDPKLRSLFAAQWGYYGSTPSRSSFAIQALVVKHFLHGGYYPIGGAKEIARTLLRTVANAGGWTRIRADVEEILVEKGRAVGVRMRDGEEIRAPRVISAAGIASTVTRLLPESERRQAWAQSVASLRPAPAHVCLYLGFEGDIRQAGATAANKWFYNTFSTEAAAWEIDKRDDKGFPQAPCLYCSFPSLKDPLHDPGPQQLHTGEVVTFVPWESFERWLGSRWYKRGADYDDFKSELQESLLEQFLAKMPALRPHLRYVEMSTPLSTDNFTRPMAGSIYGIEPTPERFENRWLRPKAPIGNLYFSGSEVASVGVIGAMMGGLLAAMAVEPVDVFRFLRRT